MAMTIHKSSGDDRTAVESRDLGQQPLQGNAYKMGQTLGSVAELTRRGLESMQWPLPNWWGAISSRGVRNFQTKDQQTMSFMRFVLLAIAASITSEAFFHALVAGSEIATAVPSVDHVKPESGPLADFLRKPDRSYAWTMKRSGRIGTTDYTELLLSSQTWRGHVWRHRLFVLRPLETEDISSQALLMVSGGHWNSKYGDSKDDSPIPMEVMILAPLAAQLRAPVVVLMDVPHQPLFGGMVEDELIAKMFDEFIKSRDAELLAILPMVKSVVRAMDAVQQFCQESLSFEVERFTVTGASKRGWTTWLAGASDDRITAIAPIIIDMLNMRTQRRHQLAAWGEYSEQISDYKDQEVLDRLDSAAGQQLVDIVDPYAYRRHLALPKLIILGTNDRYWTLDAINQYWDGLKGAKHVLYLPNHGHDVRDLPRVLAAVSALHEENMNGRKLPDFDWKFQQSDRSLVLRVRSDISPTTVRAWTTSAPTLDFRSSEWSSKDMIKVEGDWYQFELPIANVNQAIFAEVVYDRDGDPLCLSTTLQVLPITAPTHSKEATSSGATTDAFLTR